MPCLRNASIGELPNQNDTFNSLPSRNHQGALVAAANHVPMGRVYPEVDGPDGFLPELPSRLITSRSISKVDFIGGHCPNDGRTFVGGSSEDFVTDEDVATMVFSRWGSHIVSLRILNEFEELTIST